ncbi:hypothetical protein D3C77_595960 [compost metagenome]
MQRNNRFRADSYRELGRFPIVHVADNSPLPAEIISSIDRKQGNIWLNSAHSLDQFREKHRIAGMIQRYSVQLDDISHIAGIPLRILVQLLMGSGNGRYFDFGE